MSAALRIPTSDLDPEAMLLARLRAGDEAGFEELVRASGPRMLAAARRLLRNEEDARDVVQEAFLHAFRALPRFAGDARLSTWLHRIVINAALMRLRSRKRRPEESIDDLLPHFDADGRRLGDGPEPLPADVVLERADLRARVRHAIAALPDGYRTVLELRDLEDLDTEETARLLGISEAAVKTRLHRARQALRTLVARELEDGAAPRAVRIEDWIATAAS
jgi:RNA polymerase sigma-70 factor (ECF subfamily)